MLRECSRYMRLTPATTVLHGYGETSRVPDRYPRTPHTRVSPEEKKSNGKEQVIRDYIYEMGY